VKAFNENHLDAVFATGDSESINTINQLMHTPGLHLFNFLQADAYTRHVNYLSKILLPRGSINLGKNIPEEDVTLVGPTTELIARENMNSALIDALLEAVDEVHSPATLYRKRGEVPVLLENEYRSSNVPALFGDQLYALRGHIGFVRERLLSKKK
jgi:hypothetical protein